jgi:hypothetical protein
MREQWIQANGVPIAVDDMSEKHVRNVLKMLIRNNRIIGYKTPERTPIDPFINDPEDEYYESVLLPFVKSTLNIK